MRYPKYKLAFPGKHVWVFNGKPMTQFDGYILNTTAIGSGLVSASTNKGFYGDSAQIFLSAAPHYALSGVAVDYGEYNDLVYTFGKKDAILSAYFKNDEIRNIYIVQTEGGVITAIPISGYDGDEITLSNTPSSKYEFNSYGITGATLTGNKFVLSGSDVTANASWKKILSLVLQQTTGGTISANKLSGYVGDVITLSNTPSSHYYFNNYNITGATLTGNQFKFGTSDVTAAGSFAQGISGPVRFSAAGKWTPTANAEYHVDNIGAGPRDFNVQIDSLPCMLESMNIPQAWIKNINGSSFFNPVETNYTPCSSNYTLGYGAQCNMSGDVPIYYWGDISGNSALSSESNFLHDTGRERLWMADIGYRNLSPHGQVGSHGIGWFTSVGTISTIESIDAAIKYHWNNVPKMSASLSAFHWKVNYNGDRYNVSFKYNPGYNWWGVAGYYTTTKPARVLTINSVAGGNVSASKLTATDGEIITLSQTANMGYTFNNYSITGATLTGNEFMFNGQNVTVQPNYTHNVYSLELQTDGHGKLAADKTTGYYNSTTILTATPSANYEFSAYRVTGGSINNNIFTWTNTANATAKAFFVTASTIPVSARVTIGNQTWMKYDLQINDGGAGITTAFTAVEGNTTAYNTYRSRFGTPTFYQISAAQRVANNIPGWHLPTSAEWQQLIDYVGGTSALISNIGWTAGNGTDPYGFGLLPYYLLVLNADVPPRARLAVGEHAEPWTNTIKNGSYYTPWIQANNYLYWDTWGGYDYKTVRLIKDS